MKPQTSPSRWRARLAVPAIALTALAGAAAGTPALAASTAAGQASGHAPAFTWHALTLLNGWKSASTSKLDTGKPAWAIRDGVVYLRGAIRQSVPDGEWEFAVLPKQDRPAHELYFEISTNTASPCNLYIDPDGGMEAYDGQSETFSSLAAISFPTPAVTSHKLTLKNGWKSSQSTYDTGSPEYAVSHGVVYLSGSLHGGTKKLAFVLPKAARPAHLTYIPVYTLDGTHGWVKIEPSGVFEAGGASAAGYTSLAGISFPSTTAKWHAFKLVDDWHSGAAKFHTAAPSYAIVNDVVFLTGSMYESSTVDGLWTFVPSAARAAHVLHIKAYAEGGAPGLVGMAANLGLVSSNPFSTAQALTSLGGIAYPPSS